MIWSGEMNGRGKKVDVHKGGSGGMVAKMSGGGVLDPGLEMPWDASGESRVQNQPACY